MGYWTTNKDGESFATNPGPEMIWGDAPADIMDQAIADINKAFLRDVGRNATTAEIIAGVKFSMGGKDE